MMPYTYEAGKVYHVEIDDCCVQGEFTSLLTGIADLDEKGNPVFVQSVDSTETYGKSLYFENGVYLEWGGGVSLTEVEGD